MKTIFNVNLFFPGNDADNDNSTDDNKTGGKKPVNGTLDPEVLELRRQIEKLSSISEIHFDFHADLLRNTLKP